MDGKATVALRPLRAEDRSCFSGGATIRDRVLDLNHVTAEEHNAWFARIFGECAHLRRSDRQPGQIRFVRENGSLWAVSVYLMKEFTGKGLASR